MPLIDFVNSLPRDDEGVDCRDFLVDMDNITHFYNLPFDPIWYVNVMVRNNYGAVCIWGEKLRGETALFNLEFISLEWNDAVKLAHYCFPRATLCTQDQDGRGLYLVLRSRLLLSGDVEENPGPGLLVCVLTGLFIYTSWEPLRSLAGDKADTLIRSTPFVGGVLSDCEADDVWIRTVRRDNGLWFVEPVEVPRLSGVCDFLRNQYPGWRYLSMPPPPRPGLSDYAWYYASCVITTAFLGVLCSIFATFSLYRYIRGYNTIRVVSDSRGFRVNALKDVFKNYTLTAAAPHGRDDAHVVLAYERRFLERFCLDQLLSAYLMCRDVGGSRNRFPDLADKKHICTPCLDAADILRDLKSTGVFGGCNTVGQHCPSRHTIPAAMLSHSDYHMTIDDLSAIITGPTFIINHDFDTVTDLGGYYDLSGTKKFECTATVASGLVSMTPAGGTPYGPHPYHHWKGEGAIVGKHGASVYVRLGKYGSTSVYYAFPATGDYPVNGRANLVTSTEPGHHFIGKLELYVQPNTYTIGPYTVNREVIDESSAALFLAPRNDMYLKSLFSLVSAKLKAKKLPTVDIQKAVMIASYLADNMAANNACASVLTGTPSTYGWRERLWAQAMLYRWAPRVLLDMLVVPVERMVPYQFRTKVVAVYQKFSMNSPVDYDPKRPDNQPFQNEVPAADAPVDSAPDNGPGPMPAEHDNEPVDESAAQSAPTAPVPPPASNGEGCPDLPPVKLDEEPPAEEPGSEDDSACDAPVPPDEPLNVTGFDLNDSRKGVLIRWHGEDTIVRPCETTAKVLPHGSAAEVREFVEVTQRIVQRMCDVLPEPIDFRVLQLVWYSMFGKNKSVVTIAHYGGSIRCASSAQGVPIGAVVFRGMGYTVSRETARGAQDGKREPENDGLDELGMSSQKFPQDRSRDKRHRPKEHKPKKR